MIFEDRASAGRQLAQALAAYRGSEAIVLALPRGGVVVGYEVAHSLGLPLDVVITRKIGAPGNPEYAIGALAETGELQLNEQEIAYFGIPASYIQEEVAQQRREIERRKLLYRGGRDLPPLAGKTVLLVDDGIATGFTITATIRAVRGEKPASIVVAVPVAPPSTVAALRTMVEQVVCLETPEPFMAVGAWYRSFDQVSDEEVRQYLAASRHDAGHSAA